MNIFLLAGILSINTITKAPEQQIPLLGGKAAPKYLDVENRTYQIGDIWGKKIVTKADLNESEVLRKAASLTAKIGGATGFLLGKYDGEYVFATNNHVCPSAFRCQLSRANFPQLGKRFRVKTFLGTFKEIDFALMTLTIPKSDQKSIDDLLLEFDFTSPIYPGQKLLTVGFGIANNSRRKMVANQDNDCKVFSLEDDFRYMADPDSRNPGPYKVWSFANGCDVSHGDSGSAMIDREEQTIVGIIWTGKIPKSPKVQDSEYLNKILSEASEEVWSELSYAVPAAKIAEVMQSKIDNGSVSGRKASLIRAILK